jgi:hypothetical protein
MGTVYKGSWRGCPVAIKKLRLAESGWMDEGLVDSLKAEAQLMWDRSDRLFGRRVFLTRPCF